MFQDGLVKCMPLELLQLPYEEDNDFFGDQHLQVFVGYYSNPKANRGSFMHGNMSSFPPINPTIIAMISILVRHAFLVV